jgi:hypothetical protein
LGHSVTVRDISSAWYDTTGKVERLYWREEQLWVRLRSRDGQCLALRWSQTDLPPLTPLTVVHTPLFSPQILVDLVRHLQHRGRPAPLARRPPS